MSRGDVSRAKSRSDVLAEARLLDLLESEWSAEHAAAVCLMSASSLLKSDCPRIYKQSVRGVKGRNPVRFVPWQVRQWNAERTITEPLSARSVA